MARQTDSSVAAPADQGNQCRIDTVKQCQEWINSLPRAVVEGEPPCVCACVNDEWCMMNDE